MRVMQDTNHSFAQTPRNSQQFSNGSKTNDAGIDSDAMAVARISLKFETGASQEAPALPGDTYFGNDNRLHQGLGILPRRRRSRKLRTKVDG